MKRKNYDQLLSMTEEEKIDRTSRESFSNRGNILRGDKDLYLTKNEMPYIEFNGHEVEDHLTLRSDSKSIEYIMKEGFSLYGPYMFEGYTLIVNSDDKKSVKRPHLHLLKLK